MSDKNESKAVRAAEEAQHSRKAGEVAEAGSSTYEVAKGLSLTTCRGIVDQGEPVSPLDFCRHAKDIDKGKARIDELVKAGLVVNKKP